MSTPHSQRKPRPELSAFSPSPDAYASSLSPQGRGNFGRPHTKLSPHTPNCHAELVSASLLQPAEIRPRRQPLRPEPCVLMNADATHKESPDFGAFFCSHPACASPLSPQGRGGLLILPTTKARPGLSAFSPSPDAYASPLSPQGRGNFLSCRIYTKPFPHTKLSCRTNIKLSC